MKPKLFLSMSTLFFAVVFSGSCLAQETSLVKIPGIVHTAGNTSANTSTTTVTPKVEKVFYQYFKDATDLRWTIVNDNFFVSFTMGNQQNTALFKKNGYMINHVSHGYEMDLPEEIRRMIKLNPEYFDYKITNVMNIIQDKKNVWAAYLEKDKNIVLLRVEDGTLEEVDHFQKP